MYLRDRRFGPFALPQAAPHQRGFLAKPADEPRRIRIYIYVCVYIFLYICVFVSR